MWKVVCLPALALVFAESVEHSNVGNSTSRFVVVNGCSSSPLWIAHIVNGQIGPDKQDVKILPGGNFRFSTSTSSGSLSATRYWPKMGCDENGSNCAIGDSGGPGEGCVIRAAGKDDDYSHCSPPVDTKFEATFGTAPAMDTVDMSLVDGYTLPFKLEVTGGSCTRHQQPFQEMDCSGLSLNQCPTAEPLNGQTMSLKATNPKTGKVAGCYSPCMRLTDNKWVKSPVFASDSTQAGPYCCEGADGSPAACDAGPILQTQYLKEKNGSCQAAYGYAFDDKVATISCSTSTEYTLTFSCPVGFGDESQIVLV